MLGSRPPRRDFSLTSLGRCCRPSPRSFRRLVVVVLLLCVGVGVGLPACRAGFPVLSRPWGLLCRCPGLPSVRLLPWTALPVVFSGSRWPGPLGSSSGRPWTGEALLGVLLSLPLLPSHPGTPRRGGSSGRTGCPPGSCGWRRARGEHRTVLGVFRRFPAGWVGGHVASGANVSC